MVKIEEIMEMTVDERISMIEKIWESIDPTDVSIPLSHQLELENRLKRYEDGETNFFSWDEIKSELRSARR